MTLVERLEAALDQAAGLGWCKASNASTSEACRRACGYCIEKGTAHPYFPRLKGDTTQALTNQADLWTWLSSQHSLELSWGSADDPSEAGWMVHRVSGNRSDREWTLIAYAETALEAVQAAAKALSALGGDHG